MLPTQKGEVSLVYSRHRFAYEYVAKYVEGKSVLDVGCGAGYGCQLLSQTARQVVGVDQNASAIDYCRHNFNADNIEYICMDGNKLEFEQKFDIVVTFQVIEHFHDVSAFIEQLKNAVAPGGMLLISTPNVRQPEPETSENPFHFSEMNYAQFNEALSKHLNNFRIVGVGYASPNRLRQALAKSPLYKLGRFLNRGSRLKK